MSNNNNAKSDQSGTYVSEDKEYLSKDSDYFNIPMDDSRNLTKPSKQQPLAKT